MNATHEYRWARAALAACYRKLGDEEEYGRQRRICRQMNIQPFEKEYNQACVEALCGNVDKALELLKVALDKKQLSPDHARRDSDFEFIREDPRFKRLVEESGRS